MARNPSLINFSVEFQPLNLQLGVKDIRNRLVSSAEVLVESGGLRQRTTTDLNGCVSAVARPGVISTLCVTRRGYLPLTQKFILVNQAQLQDPTKNLFLFVMDPNDQPLPGSRVTVQSFSQSLTEIANAQGLVETDYIPARENLLNIRSAGYGPVDEIIPAFTKPSCGNSAYRAIPVFTLNRLAAYVILQPGPASIGTPFTLQVEARDENGDLMTDLEADVTVRTTGNARLANNGLVDIQAGRGTINILNTTAETVTLTLEDTEGVGLDVSSTVDLTFS